MMKKFNGFVTRPWFLTLLLLSSLIALLAACGPAPTPEQPTSAPPATGDTGTPSDTSAELLANTWLLTSINGEAVPAHVRTTLQFDPSNNSIGGTGGCNTYFGSYTLDGNSLSFGEGIGSTMMACADPDVDQTEINYFAALPQTASYSLSEGTLSLLDASGATILTFVVEEPISLTGTVWQVTAFNNGQEAIVSPLPDVPVTVNFGEDGSTFGQASCNNFTGTYTAEQNSLSFGPLATTMMMCEEDVMAQEAAFLAALQGATNFRQDGPLLTLLNADGAQMVLLTPMSEEATAPATGVATSGDTSNELLSTLWVLDNINGDPLPAEVRITLQFDAANNGFSGSGGCNNYFGSFILDGENFSFGEGIGSTMMACEEPAMSTEAAYFNVLPSITRYHLNEGSLFLLDAESNKVLTFNADQPPTLAGSSWSVISYNNGREAIVSTLAESPISVTFGEDGTIFGNASCNNFNGGFTVDGTTIAIGPLATTRMMCGEEVMAQEAAFLAALQSAVSFSQDGNLLSLFDANGMRQVDLSLGGDTATGASSKTEPAFFLTNWVLGAYRGEPITAVFPTILFTSDQFSGNAGCNTFFGSYTIDGQTLNISPNIGSTMMMCPDAQMQIEQLFLSTLPLATSYRIENGQLHLLDAADEVLLSFYEAVNVGLEDTPWLVTGYGDGQGGFIATLPGTSITAEFMAADGMVFGNATCNSYRGGYTLDGNNLTLEPLASTMMMCPSEEEMAQETAFLAAFAQAATFTIEGAKLTILDANALPLVEAMADVNPIVADEVGVIPTVDLAEVSFNTAVFGNQLGGELIPRTPYTPNSLDGAPTHLQFTSNGTPFMRIYPIKPYMAMWDAAGNQSISQNVARLQEVLTNKPLTLENNPPILPPTNGYPDIVGQVRYFEFANGAGSGVRYLARFVTEASPLLADQLHYHYQGLTSDGHYYLSVILPVSVAGLPSELTTEEINAIFANYDAHLAEMTGFVNNLAPDQTNPNLSELDGVISQMNLRDEATGSLNPALTPAIAGLSESNFAIDLTGFARWYFWQVVGPYPHDPNSPPGLNGFPRHALLSFDGQEVMPELFAPRQPQMRLIPLEEYKALFTGDNWTEVDKRLSQWQTILAERPDPATLAGQLPFLPEVSGIPVMQANVAYVDSAQFQGVRYLTALKFDVSPVTQDELVYIYTGFSSDGRFLLSFSAPVNTAVLPPADNEFTPAELDALSRNFDQYRADLLTELNAATDFAPSLTTLDNVVSSVNINR